MVPGVASPAAALPLVISTGRSAFPLSFRAEHEVRSREICFEPGGSAAISFQAANGGAPLGYASLRPLPESTASSLRDNLYLPGPVPLPSPGVDMSALRQPESFTPQRHAFVQFTVSVSAMTH